MTESLSKSARISAPGRKIDACRQDRRLEDRVPGSVESQEVAKPTLGDRLDEDAGRSSRSSISITRNS